MEDVKTGEDKLEPTAACSQGSAGREENLGDLFCSHRKRLYRAAYSVLGCREDAEDAVQDGLLSAVKNLKSFEGRSQILTWLTRIVANAALMRLRRRKGSRLVSIDREWSEDSPFSLASIIADHRLGPFDEFARREKREVLRTKSMRLPQALRSAFVLRYIQGMSIGETAHELNLTKTAIKARLHRARRLVLEDVQKAASTPTCCRDQALRGFDACNFPGLGESDRREATYRPVRNRTAGDRQREEAL